MHAHQEINYAFCTLGGILIILEIVVGFFLSLRLSTILKSAETIRPVSLTVKTAVNVKALHHELWSPAALCTMKCCELLKKKKQEEELMLRVRPSVKQANESCHFSVHFRHESVPH